MRPHALAAPCGALVVALLSACTSSVYVPPSRSPSTTEPSASIAGASPTASPTASHSSSPTGVKVALRPVPSVAPSTHVLSYERGSDIGAPSLRLLVTAEGRVISDGPSGTLVERTLALGVAGELAREAIATGLFESDATYNREPLPGTSPLGHGVPFIVFTVRNGDRNIHVSAIPTLDDDNLYQPSAARQKLTALAVRFDDLSWLPASSWRSASPRPYEASAFRLFVNAVPSVAAQGQPVFDAYWPFSIELDKIGDAIAGPASSGPPQWRCVVLARADALLVGDAFVRAGALPAAFDPSSAATNALVGWSAGNGIASLQLVPLLPPEAATCAGASPQ